MHKGYEGKEQWIPTHALLKANSSYLLYLVTFHLILETAFLCGALAVLEVTL